MSILREDFSQSQIAAIEEAATSAGIPFSTAVRMLLDYGINARRGLGSDSLPVRGNHYKEGDSGEGDGSLRGCWEGGGASSNEELPVSVPQSSGRAKRRAKKSVAEPPAFTEFYDEIYPRKVGRAAALLVWLRLESELPTLDELRAVVAQQIDENDWANPEKAQFIPHPRTWLSQKRWNDKPLRGAVLVQPKSDPAAEVEADRKQAMARARYAYDGAALKLCPGSDGWGISSRTWLFDGLEALQSPEDFEARLDHVRALIARLRALGAFPLVAKRADPGLIFPACGGGPWRPYLIGSDGWSIDVGQQVGSRVARLQAEEAALLPHIDCDASPPPEKVEEVYERHVRDWPLRHDDTGFDETYYPDERDDGADGYDMVGDDTPLDELRDDWDDEGTHVCGDRSEP